MKTEQIDELREQNKEKAEREKKEGPVRAEPDAARFESSWTEQRAYVAAARDVLRASGATGSRLRCAVWKASMK